MAKERIGKVHNGDSSVLSIKIKKTGISGPASAWFI